MNEATEDAPSTSRADLAVVAVVVVCGIVLRFYATSPLWLDEALSVNIASLSVGDVLEALRRDGHPPLYYLALHYWMEVFGDGDVAVRSLSGIASVATLFLAARYAWRRAGRHAAYATLVVMALAPFSLRYATEARMYSFLALFGLGAWMLAEDLLERPSRSRWVLLALITGLGVLTHYWALFMGVAAVGLLAVHWRRSGDRSGVVRVLSALATGSLLFLPWLPSFLYQAGHTGTPWASAGRPTQAAQELVNGIGGGYYAEGTLYGVLVVVLVALGAFTTRSSGHQLVLDLRTAPAVRPAMLFVSLTLAVGFAMGIATESVFIARYAAGVVPLILVAAGVGVARIPGAWIRRGAVVVLSILAGGSNYLNIVDPRTQGDAIAAEILAEGGADDLVVFCPDQLGPATLRGLPPSTEAVGVPTLERPDLIDWVDYAERNEGADGATVAAEILERAGDRSIWLVFNGGYRTYLDLCPSVLASLTAERPSNDVLQAENPRAFERAALYRFDP